MVNGKLLTTYSGELCQLLLTPIVILLISSNQVRLTVSVILCIVVASNLNFFCRFGRKKSIIASLILAAIGAFASVLIESEGGGSKGENNQYPNTVCYFPAGRSAW